MSDVTVRRVKKDAGLRCGEILALPPYGVKWETGKLHIDRQVWRKVVDSRRVARRARFR